MKLLALLIVIITIFAKLNASFSFLKEVTGFTSNYYQDYVNQKKYFLSDQIELNWIDSRRFCESNGLRLAKLSLRELNSFHETWDGSFKYIFDGSNIKNEPKKCVVYEPGDDEVNFLISVISCTDETFKFVCESYKESVEYVDVKLNTFPRIDETLKFMKYLANYTDDRNVVTKAYYISDYGFYLNHAKAALFCKSINMELASPQSQAEYENLSNLLRNSNIQFYSLAIDIYRSEDTSTWMTQGKPLDYLLEYFHSLYPNDDCIFFKYDKSISAEYSCEYPSQFICEQRTFFMEKEVKNNDPNELLEPFVSFTHQTTKRTVSKSLFKSQENFEVSWMDALAICKSLGWDLFVPESEVENDLLLNKFNNDSRLPDFHVGLSRLGNQGRWYSVATGNDISYNIDVLNSHTFRVCGYLGKFEDKFKYYGVECVDNKKAFMCQKVYEYGTEKADSYDNSIEEVAYYSLWMDDRAKTVPEIMENFFTPKPPKNRATCDRTQDIFSQNGSYIKTACIVFTEKSNVEACIDDDMQLFIIESSRMQKDLLEFATDVFGSGKGSMLWINGNKLSDGYWYTFGPQRAELLQGIRGVTDFEIYISVDDPNVVSSDWMSRSYQKTKNNYQEYRQNCLIIQAFGDFIVSPWSCNQNMYSVCEYRKTGSNVPEIEATTTTTTTSTTSATLTTKTTETTSTTPTLNFSVIYTEICEKTQPLFDNEGYLKSLCYVSDYLTYDAADEMCKTNGMKLLTKNLDTLQTLLAASRVIFADKSVLIFDLWVEGKLHDVEIGKDYTIRPSNKCYAMLYHRQTVDFFMDKCVYQKPFLCEFIDENY